MTGPEHYVRAQELVEGRDIEMSALVHAMLALAAATAMAACDENGMRWADFNAWDQVAGVPIPDTPVPTRREDGAL
ncbi:MAG: hypothetical protein ACRDTO_00135 [Mycobacterium sp.]